MKLVYKGVEIIKEDKIKYKELSEKANLARELERISNEKKAYLVKQNEVKKFRISAKKAELTSLLQIRSGRKQEISQINKDKDFKIKSEISRLDSLTVEKFISREKSDAEKVLQNDLDLIEHKYNPNSKVYANSIIEANQKFDEKMLEVSKYNVNVSELEKQKADFIIKEEKNAAARISFINEQILKINKDIEIKKEEYKKYKKDYKANNKDLIKARLDKFKESVKVAKVNAKEAKAEIVNSNIYLNSFYEPVLNTEIKNKNSDKFISFKEYLNSKSVINKSDEFSKEKTKILKLQYLLEKAKYKNDDSFDSKAKIIDLEYKVEYNKEMLSTKEKFKKKIEMHSEVVAQGIVDNDKAEIKEKFNKEKAKIIEAKKSDITRIKRDYKAGIFSKESKNNSIKLAKGKAKSDIREAKLDNPLIANAEKARFLKIDRSRVIEKQKNLMNSIIDDAIKNIPTKSIKNQRWFAAILSLILPGTGQMLNKQFVKGGLLLFVSALVYGFLLPVALGVISFKGEGIFGLITLSPSRQTFIGTVYDDARFRIVEGIIAIFAIVIGAIALILSSRDAYQFGKAKELGLRPKNARALRQFFKSNGLPYILSAPAIIAILFVVILPLATTILLGFTNYSSGHIPPGNPLNWAGLENFKEVFSSGYGKSFGYVAVWTFIWTFSVSFGVIALGTIMAFMVDQKRIKGKVIFTTIYILPWAVPAFATILFFSSALDNGGLYNNIFHTNINFKQDANWTRALLITLQIWLGHSYIFLLMTGVKKSISSDFYEAASIDGASKWSQFWKISAPIILFQIAPLLIGQFVFNFNNYGIIWMFNDGGPSTGEALMGNPGATDIFISLIFKMTTASTSNRIALASAFTIVMSIGVVMVSAIGFLRSKSFKGEM